MENAHEIRCVKRMCSAKYQMEIHLAICHLIIHGHVKVQ